MREMPCPHDVKRAPASAEPAARHGEGKRGDGDLPAACAVHHGASGAGAALLARACLGALILDVVEQIVAGLRNMQT